MELHRGNGGAMRVGHRGAAAVAAENSLAAIAAAARAGLDAVEVDVSRAADGSIVLAHGPEIPADAPSLDDGLAAAAGAGLAVQLDVKTPGVERDVADAVRRHDLLDRAFVSSFSLPILAAFGAVEPGLPRSFTYPDDRFGLAQRRLLRPAVRGSLAAMRVALPRRLPSRLRSVGASAATLNWTVMSPAVVAACHRSGAAVFVWTVNEPELARRLAEMGADGIISDDPGIFLTS